MPTRAGETLNGGVGAAAKQVAEHATAIARLELQLATAELRRKATALGLGLGLGVGAALFGFFGLAFAVAAAAAALTIVLPVWAALLIMTGVVLGLAGLLGLLAAEVLRKGYPEQFFECAQDPHRRH